MQHTEFNEHILYKIEAALRVINEKFEAVSELKSALSRLENNVERLINIVEAPTNIERSLLARVSCLEHDLDKIKTEIEFNKHYRFNVRGRLISSLLAGVILGAISTVVAFFLEAR